MNKKSFRLLSRALALLVLISQVITPIPTAALDNNVAGLSAGNVSSASVGSSVYAEASNPPVTPTAVQATSIPTSTPTPTPTSGDTYGNDFNTASSITEGVEYTGSIEYSGDLDYFSFVPAVTGMYCFETTGTGDTYGYLYNAEQTHLDSGSDEGVNRNFYIAYRLEATKTYYLRVQSNTLKVPYILKVNRVTDDYGNDTNSAASVQIGSEKQAAIDYYGDHDYFKFVPSVSGPYRIESTGTTDVTGTLYSRTTSYDISSSNKNFRIRYTLSANTTYYIDVYHASRDKDSVGTGAYAFTITPIEDEHGNTYETATNMQLSAEYTAVSNAAEDPEYFKFVPTQQGVYNFESTGTADTHAYLYNSSGTQLEYDNSNGVGGNFNINYRLEANTTYYLVTYSNSIDVPYQVKVAQKPDDHGNDTNTSTFIQIGDIVPGEINYAGDNDYFRFIPAVTGPYVIESTGTTDVTGTLRNVTTSTNISTTNKNFRITQVLNANQVYYLYVYHANSDKDSAETTGAYSIRVSAGADDHGNNFDSATPVEIGTEVQAVKESDGDYDYLKIVPEVSGMYGIEGTVTSGDPHVELYNKDRTYITGDDDSGVGYGFYLATWLNANETYYLNTWTNVKDSSYKVKVTPYNDDYGYSESTAAEITLDSIISGEINFACDYDYFKFTPTVSGPYLIESTGSTDVDGRIESTTSTDNSSTDKNFSISYTMTANKTYYIRVGHHNQNKDTAPNTGAYGLKITQKKDDHSDTFDTATEVLESAETTVTKESEGDYDYLKITPTISGMYSMECTVQSGDPHLELYNKDKTYITGDDDSGAGYGFYLALWLNANETYYLKTWTGTRNAPYIVKITYYNDDHGYSNLTATQLTLDTEISGKIDFTSDTDYFKFTPAVTGPYIIESTGNTDVNGRLDGYTSNNDININNKNFRIKYTLNANQTYYIHVWHNYQNRDITPNTGDYGLKISVLPDDHGNSFETASDVQVDTDIQVLKESNGDYDYLKFTVPVSGMYGIESTGTGDPEGDLYNSSKTRITIDYGSGIDNNFYISVRLEANQVYYIKTWSNSLNVPYTVRINTYSDDHGYDNNSATTLVLNTETEGQINFTGDNDYFKFTPAVAGPYIVESSGTTDVDGQIVGYSSNNDISSSNKNFRVSYWMNANQTYYVQVFHHSQGDRQYTNTGAYKLKLSQLADDHKNTYAGATEIQVGEEVQAVQECDGDYDYVKFTPAVSGMYGIESTGSGNPTGELYNSTPSLMTRDYDTGIGSNFYIANWLNANQVYYLRVYSATQNVPYKVKVTSLTDDHGYNNSTATVVTAGTEIQGEINFQTDTDYFKFVPAVAGPYYIESTGSTDVDGTLQNNTSNNDISTSNKNFRIAYTLNANQTYYIQVNHHNSSDKDNGVNTGAYGLKITQLTDDLGNDFNTATLSETRKLISARIDSFNDYDYVKFVPTETASYTIESFGKSNMYLNLYNDAKTNIKSDDNSAGDGLNFKINFNLEAGKTYYLRMYNSTSYGYGNYQFAIYPGTDDHKNEINYATLVLLQNETAGTFNYTGDIDCFRFTPPKDSVYRIKSLGDTDVSCEIYDSIGNILGSSDNGDDADKNFMITQSLPANRTCYIKVFHADMENGLGAFRVLVEDTDIPAGDDYGNSFDTAAPIELGQKLGTINFAMDIDFFKFVPESTGMYTFESISTSDLLGYLYNENRNQIASDNNTGIGTNFYMPAKLEGGKAYYIKVIHSSASANGVYMLNVSKVPDDHGNTNAEATSLMLGDDLSCAIDYKCDTDVFSFVPDTERPYIFGIEGNSNVRVKLYNQNGINIYADSRTGENQPDLSIPVTLSIGQTYYIKVSHRDNLDLDNAGTGSYRLKLSYGFDDHGDTFEKAGEVATDRTINGNIDSFGDVDFFKFTPLIDGNYTITTTGTTNTIGYLYDSQRALRVFDDNSGDGDNFYLSCSLVKGQVYYVKVANPVSTGIGAYGLFITSDNIAPRAPSYVGISGRTSLSVSLQWTAATDNVGVTGYDIYRDGVMVGSTAQLSYTDSVPAAGIYQYTVKARDLSGNVSVASSAVVFDCEKPSKPTNLIISGTTVKTASLAWSASQDQAGVGVQGYYVYRNGKNIKTVFELSYTDIGLEPDTTYAYAVSAFDKAGNESLLSDSKDAKTTMDSEAPSIPQNVVLAAKTGSSITIAWDVCQDNYGVAGYEVFRNGISVGKTQETLYKDRNLTEGTSYRYTVKAYDKFNNISAASKEVSAIPLKPHILRVDPLAGVTVGGNTSQIFRVYFANSSNLTGTTAKFEYSADGNQWTGFNSNVYGPYTSGSSEAYFYSYLDLGPLMSGSYQIRYTVLDEEGLSDIETVSCLVDRTHPLAPQNLTATPEAGKVHLAWAIPQDNDIRGYRVYRSNTQNGTYSQLASVSGAANNFYSDAAVEINSTYYYKVLAYDRFNQDSPYSNVASTTAVLDNIPPVVLGIEPANNTLLGPSAQITVRAEDNIAVSSIVLQYSLNGTQWIDIGSKNTSGTAAFAWSTTPLTGNVSVHAVVYDRAGNKSDGTPIRVYRIDTTGPEKVRGLSYTANTTYVVLKWSDVADQDLAYFRVERKKDDGTYENVGTTSTTLGMNVTGLRAASTYTYRVVAYDKLGNMGTPSDDLKVTTLSDTVNPWITGIGPSPSYFGSKIALWATARDNANIASVNFQVSNDLITWSVAGSVYNPNYSSDYTARFDYDVSTLPQGKIYVRAVAYDGAGRMSPTTGSFTYAEYMIDHEGPSAPSDFAIEPGAGSMTLKWKLGSDQDLKHYKVYKSESGAGPFVLLEDKVLTLGYIDRNVLQNKTYYYQVSAVDIAGNEGARTAVQSGTPIADDVKPQILSISPVEGSILPANPQIAAFASDNYKLGHIKVEYKAYGDVNAPWVNAFEKDLTEYSEVTTFTFNTNALAEGKYSIRAVVTDSMGNISEPKVITYSLNLLPPEKPVVAAKAGGWKAELSWAKNAENDFAGYRILRSATAGGPYKMVKETRENAYTDVSLTPGISYYYVVDALDTSSNANRSSEVVVIPTDEDNTNPTAFAGDDQVITTGVALWFDGTASKDNNRIAEYLWNFGDGTTSSQAQPSHVYNTVGTYNVVLTVKDPAGNVSTDTLVITVKPQQQVGTLEIKVVDDSTGIPLGGASVVVEYSDGGRYQCTTNGSGMVNVVAPEGDCKVYAYKTDYKPAFTSSAVAINKKTPVTVKLASGQLVVGELTVRRLTLDEIKDAGIDVTAPDNQHIYKFEVHLAFKGRPLPPQEIIASGTGAIIRYKPLYIPGDGGVTYIGYPSAIPVPHHPEIRPTIAYLVIPGEARFLKEFFEVELALENMADSVFVIEQSKAILKLPDGLSLARTDKVQSLEVDLGDFIGGEKKQVKWIIRGDKKGFYTLEADFTGILQPFGEPVKASFKNEKPFRVWAEDALKLNIYAQDKVDKGHPYYVRFELENVSDIPVYYPAIELLEGGKQNYFYAPNQQLVKSVEELPAGQKLVKEYMLVPAITGDLDLSQSYVLKTGGDCTIPSTIYSVRVPQNDLNVAPRLTETRSINGTVTLSWGAVQGALGYKIYSIRKDLIMSKDPAQLIASVNADSTTYTFSEIGESKNYIITTLMPEGEILRHAIRWPDGLNPALPVVTVNPDVVFTGTSTNLTITSNQNGFPVKFGTAKIGQQSYALDHNGQAFVTVTPQTAGELTVDIYDANGKFLVSKKIPVEAKAPVGTGTGLRADYFDNMDLTELKLTRIDQRVDFNWASGSPDASMGADSFSARYTGYVQPIFNGEYTFYTVADDGVRLWVNDKLVIDDWKNHAATEKSGKITLTAGQKYVIKLEYYDNTSSASLKLLWSSKYQSKEIIPVSQLYIPAYNVEAKGTGLKGEYFDNMDFTGFKLTRLDSSVGFSWGNGSPSTLMANDTFSVRWTGQLEAPTTGEYTFYASSDDGIRVWVDERLVVDYWGDHSAGEKSGKMMLFAGNKYSIRIEYYDNGYAATAKVMWSAAGRAKEVIPMQYLYNDMAAATGTGLNGEYFDNKDLTGFKMARTDSKVDFDWVNGSPDPSIAPDTFSVRWNGLLEAPETGTYTIAALSDDGTRVYVGGKLVIDHWSDHGALEKSATIALVKGERVDIKVEYYDSLYKATAKLLWTRPGQTKEVIPTQYLYTN